LPSADVTINNVIRTWLLLTVACGFAWAEIPGGLRKSLLFHATFDGGADAAHARGDRKIYNAPDFKTMEKAQPGIGAVDAEIAAGQGVRGDALRFRSVNSRALFYKAHQNTGYRPAWSGTVSFWLRVDPEKQLKGFSDPIQLTDKAYNDAAIWVDFTKDERPRHFRLGVFGDLKAWNPRGIEPDKNPDFNNRLVVLRKPPFSSDRWTHVALTWSGINGQNPSAMLYVDGRPVGTAASIKEPFTWDAEKATIRLGVSYAGLMDELAIFDTALTDAQVQELHGAFR
jgi:Concanavalin A-like lectin/glucanases superfamily